MLEIVSSAVWRTAVGYLVPEASAGFRANIFKGPNA
jgi:hypothetical protein